MMPERLAITNYVITIHHTSCNYHIIVNHDLSLAAILTPWETRGMIPFAFSPPRDAKS